MEATSTSSIAAILSDADDESLLVRIKSFRFPRGVCAALTVVCVLGCVTLAVLYGVEVSRKRTSKLSPDVVPTSIAPTSSVAPSTQVCDDLECFYQAIELVKRMNKTVDPCQDFYSYACGGWQQRHALKVNETYTSGFKSLAEDNYLVLKKALENAAVNYSSNEAVMKTVQVYNSCLNTSAVEARGSQPLRDLIRKYGGWSVTGDYARYAGGLIHRMGHVFRDLNVHSFLGIDARTDIYDSSKVILSFKPASLGMNYKYYISDDIDKIKGRNAYLTYMKAVGKALGGVAGETKMQEIYNFELKLAKIASGKDPDDELIESLVAAHRSRRTLPDWRKSLDYFSSKTGFAFNDLKEFLQIVFKRNFYGFEKTLFVSEQYFTRLASLYNTYKKYSLFTGPIIADFIMWRVVDQYIIAMPSSLKQLKETFYTSLSGSPTQPRWKQCIGLMMSPLDMPLGLLFVDTHFDDDSKKTVEEMTDLVRDAFINKLPKQTWMDTDTQEKAKEKALAIKEDIGYPAFIKDPVKLAARYTAFNTSDDLFENVQAALHYLCMKNVNTYGKPVDKDEWFYGPANVNGYYSPNQNRIVFLAGIIQPPFYEPKFPRYLKYGAIGVVIGHEITHGFDNSGRFFNKDGNMQNWWSMEAALNFISRSKCLVNQYNKFKVFDKYVNGSRTLNENIADNGGIKISYDAYQLWTKKHGHEKVLPGLGLTPEQLFFVGFAQPWCSIYTEKPAYHQLETDSHTFNKYRVLGTLSNFDKFSQAFKCASGSPMNPRNKCSVW